MDELDSTEWVIFALTYDYLIQATPDYLSILIFPIHVDVYATSFDDVADVFVVVAVVDVLLSILW